MSSRVSPVDTSFFRRLWIGYGNQDHDELFPPSEESDWSDQLAALSMALQRVRPPGIVGGSITDGRGKPILYVVEVPLEPAEQAFALGLIHDFGFSVFPGASASESAALPSTLRGQFNTPHDKPPFPVAQ